MDRSTLDSNPRRAYPAAMTMHPSRALLVFFAAGCCACAPGARRKHHATAFETRWLPVPASLAVLNIPRRQTNTFDLGKFLVIETNDVYLPAGYVSIILDSEVILTADEAKKDYLEKFLQAAYPNATGGPTAFPGSSGVGAPDVETVEAYIAGLKNADARGRNTWSQEHPGKPYPVPGLDHDALRADLLKKLEGRDAVILRDVSAKNNK